MKTKGSYETLEKFSLLRESEIMRIFRRTYTFATLQILPLIKFENFQLYHSKQRWLSDLLLASRSRWSLSPRSSWTPSICFFSSATHSSFSAISRRNWSSSALRALNNRTIHNFLFCWHYITLWWELAWFSYVSSNPTESCDSEGQNLLQLFLRSTRFHFV